MLLSRAWSLEPCVLSRRQRDRCDLLASSSASSWAVFTQAGRYGKAWVTDENPWGALDYGEWKIKRNHIGHRYKRSPLFLFLTPAPCFFSPLPYQAVTNVENCFPPQSVWGHRDSRCYSMQILPPFPAQQHSELTLLPSCVLPFAFHTVVGKKKKKPLLKKHLIIVLKRLIYTLHSAFGLSTAGDTKQHLTHFWHWREFNVLIT